VNLVLKWDLWDVGRLAISFMPIHQSLIDNILHREDTTTFHALSNAAYSPAPLSLLRNGGNLDPFSSQRHGGAGSTDPPPLTATIALEVFLSPSLA
jgi:hypothetical protein